MRWIARILGVLVVVAAVLAGALYLLPADRIARLVETRFEAATGRALTIEGDVRPGLWPEIGVKTGRVTVANADWAGGAPMIEAEGLSVGLAWAGLFGGDIRVTGVELTRPVIRLTRDAKGRANWDLGGATGSDEAILADTPSAAPDSMASGRSIALDKVIVTDGTVIYSAPGSTPVTVSAIDGTLSLPDYAGTGTLALSGEMNGEAVNADLTIDGVSAFLSDSAVPVRLEAGLPGGALTFDGDAGLSPLNAKGRLAADLNGIGALTRAFGSPSELPRGLGRDKLSLQGAMTFSGDVLGLRKTSIALDGNAMSGDLDLALGGKRPRLTGALVSGPLDLSGLSGDETPEAGEGGAAGSGWSKEPIDLSGLGALDADLSFDAERITLTESKLGRTRLNIALDDSRLVTKIAELNAYDGQVNGQIVLNGRKGVSASADLSGSAIAISRLFAELLDFDKLVSLGDMTISVLASGNSMDALMNGMNGNGSFRFGAGELLGLDLVGMIRNLDPSLIGKGKSTIFDEITGTFRIVNGVVINDNLNITAPLFTATGAGNVGLGKETLDYRIVPKLLSGEGAGIPVPVIISGTWDAPKFRLDLASIADQQVRDKAESKADQAIRKEIGAEDGVSTEDALKKKLEGELTKGLKKLFK